MCVSIYRNNFHEIDVNFFERSCITYLIKYLVHTLSRSQFAIIILLCLLVRKLKNTLLKLIRYVNKKFI